jgi:hypothetical protein
MGMAEPSADSYDARLKPRQARIFHNSTRQRGIRGKFLADASGCDKPSACWILDVTRVHTAGCVTIGHSHE